MEAREENLVNPFLKWTVILNQIIPFQLRVTLALSIALVVAAAASAEPIREDSYVEKNLISDDEVQDLEPIAIAEQEGELEALIYVIKL